MDKKYNIIGIVLKFILDNKKIRNRDLRIVLLEFKPKATGAIG